MRGPHGDIIFCRKEHAAKINSQVFPCMQGGSLMHVITAKAIALKEAMVPDSRIHQALSAPEDEREQQAVTRQVQDLCQVFTLYQRSYHM